MPSNDSDTRTFEQMLRDAREEFAELAADWHYHACDGVARYTAQACTYGGCERHRARIADLDALIAAAADAETA